MLKAQTVVENAPEDDRETDGWKNLWTYSMNYVQGSKQDKPVMGILLESPLLRFCG